MKLTHTLQSGLTLHHVFGAWQHKDADQRQVGPRYPTKAEALADTSAYAVRAGWMK